MKGDSLYIFRETFQKFHIMLLPSNWPKLSHMAKLGIQKDGKYSILAGPKYMQLSRRVLSAKGEGEKR